MKDAKCIDCKGTQNIKSFCGKCSSVYCVKCRTPEFTQQGCMLGHTYNKVEVKDNLKCDVCEVAGAFVGLQTHSDTNCKFSVC
jgi:hypothetical protein